jgi:hypothetical protein
MISNLQALAVVALLASSTLPLVASAAEPAPAAAAYYPLVGNWTGAGEISEGGQTPAKLTLSLNCKKVSAGWAVYCDMKAANDKMAMAETDLFGVDPATGQAHWYAVTNQGETHDHLAQWIDARTLKAHLAWTQEGKKMEETVTVALNGENAMDFRSSVTEDGKEVGAFSGKLRK